MHSQEKGKIKFYASIKIVAGIKFSCIVDIQYGEFFIIEKEIGDLLSDMEGNTIQEILSKFDEESHPIIQDVLSILDENNLIFFTNIPDNYPAMQDDWDYPAFISNAVLEVGDSDSLNNIEIVLDSLLYLGCKNIQFKLKESFPIEDINNLFERGPIKKFTSIELFFDTPKIIPMTVLQDLTVNNYNLSLLCVGSQPVEEYLHFRKDNFGHIYFIKDKITPKSACGIINQNNFSITIPTFTESQHFNTCLNRKIAIDAIGNIKNCPSMVKSYGNIKDTSLIDVANSPEFQEVWHIKKDMIHVCKDCEFRHVCTDCRAYVEDPEDILSKPLKCGYNPYAGEWSEWSTNPLKQKAITFYGMQDLIKTEESNA